MVSLPQIVTGAMSLRCEGLGERGARGWRPLAVTRKRRCADATCDALSTLLAGAAMPPRRSARVAAVAQQSAGFITALPQPLTLRIFLALPVDARARACCVCRAWRAALEDPVCWTHLDLTRLERSLHGIEQQPYPVLAAAAAKARGQLHALHVPPLPRPVLFEVLRANAASVRELRLKSRLLVHGGGAMGEALAHLLPSLETIMAAAPLLQVVEARDVCCEWQVAAALLHAAPPFAPVVVRDLYAHFRWREVGLFGMERVGPFAAALADATLQPALTHVDVSNIDSAALDAVLDAALARRLPSLSMSGCAPPAAAPLARLLSGNSLTTLLVSETSGSAPFAPLFDAAGAALVADALRATTALTELTFISSGLCRNPVAANTLLGALIGHPSLRSLRLECEGRPAPAECGAALAAMVAADTPALQSLSVCCLGICAHTCGIGDAGLMPLVAALRRNQHLRKLDISCSETSERFARRQLLPAVRANTSLRKFVCYGVTSGAEAMNLVERRAL